MWIHRVTLTDILQISQFLQLPQGYPDPQIVFPDEMGELEALLKFSGTTSSWSDWTRWIMISMNIAFYIVFLEYTSATFTALKFGFLRVSCSPYYIFWYDNITSMLGTAIRMKQLEFYLTVRSEYSIFHLNFLNKYFTEKLFEKF